MSSERSFLTSHITFFISPHQPVQVLTCQSEATFVDALGRTCKWYLSPNIEYGCDSLLWNATGLASKDNTTAWDACCYCGGGNWVDNASVAPGQPQPAPGQPSQLPGKPSLPGKPAVPGSSTDQDQLSSSSSTSLTSDFTQASGDYPSLSSSNDGDDYTSDTSSSGASMDEDGSTSRDDSITPTKPPVTEDV